MFQQLVYALKAEYGKRADYYTINNRTTNLTTGKISSEIVKTKIKRVVLMPMNMVRQLNMPRLNIPQTQNVETDVENHFVIIDKKDIVNHIPKPDDYLLISRKKYNIEEIIDVNDEIIILKTRHLRTEPTTEIFEETINETLELIEDLED